MPLAVTHIITTVVIVDLYRDYISKHKKYFTLHTVFLAGLFAILPDIDIVFRVLSQFFNFTLPILLQHRGITHTPFFALFFLIPALILWRLKKHKFAMYFFVATFAILFHILLDFFIFENLVWPGIMWFFPFTTLGWKFDFVALVGIGNFDVILDCIILLAWLWHEEAKHKISDFI